MKNLVKISSAACVMACMLIPTAFASNSSSNTGSVQRAVSGYTVDQSWNAIGNNTAQVTLTHSGTNQAVIEATITYSGEKYSFSGTGQKDGSVYRGSTSIDVNGVNEIVQFAAAPSLTKFVATIGNMEFIDGVDKLPYASTHSLYESNLSKFKPTKTPATSSVNPSPQALTGGSQDANVRGSGAYTGGEPSVSGEVVGNENLTVAQATGENYWFRTWLTDNYLGNLNVGAAVTEAYWNVSTNNRYIIATELYPNPPVHTASTLNFLVGYKGFQVGVSYTKQSNNYNNLADNFSYTEGLNIPASQMVYSGDSTGNGVLFKALLIAQKGAALGMYTNATDTIKLQYWEGGLIDYYFWTSPVTFNWNYQVVS